MKKIVCIEKDGLNSIFICKDHFKGVAVQVVRHVDIVSNNGGNMVNERVDQVVMSCIVNIEDGKDFKKEVEKAISKAKEFVANIKIKDKAIDGVLQDYASQFPLLNYDDKKQTK